MQGHLLSLFKGRERERERLKQIEVITRIHLFRIGKIEIGTDCSSFLLK